MFKISISLMLAVLATFPTFAEKKKPSHPKVTLKVGALSPDGSAWANHLKDMAREIKRATDNHIKMKFYFGGSQGDEPDVLKKMRIGQLHGGVFTGKTLGDIHKDIRVLELPFSFYSDHKKASKALVALTPTLNRGIQKNGLKNLGFFGIGMVYLVSQKKAAGLKELQGVKIWYWEGIAFPRQWWIFSSYQWYRFPCPTYSILCKPVFSKRLMPLLWVSPPSSGTARSTI